MVKTLLCVGTAVAVLGVAAAPAIGFVTASSHHAYAGAAKVGDPAPAWSLKDTNGAEHSLSEYAGKFVVLEWTNNQCPYVQHHYRSGNMQSLQKYAKDNGVVWLSVVSSAPGAVGYVTPEEGNQIMKQVHSQAAAELLDPTGTVGRAYGAHTTPDMMVINPKGVLIYSGAIDDTVSTEDADLKTAHNYVKAALEEALAGKPVSTPTSKPYGCGIKFAG